MSEKVDPTQRTSCSSSEADYDSDFSVDRSPTEDADSNDDSPESDDSRHACSRYYKRNNSNYEMEDLYRDLKVEPAKEQCVVSIVIEDHSKLNMAAINDAKALINHHCPGLLLEKYTTKVHNYEIVVSLSNRNSTKYSIKSEGKKAYVYLDERTIHQEYHVVHEFLHALGFEHEHQRCDAKKYLTIKYWNIDKNFYRVNMKERTHYIPITPYDPYSIMHYCFHNKTMQLKEGENTSQYGEISEKMPNQKMSELDKVAINMMYPPVVTSPRYEPVKDDNGMYYCRRFSMANHNHPGGSPISICQPADPDNLDYINGGPNCPACRVLSSPKRMQDDQWQGWSGWVYCGKNGCGPHYGHPCDDCRTVVEI